MMIAFHENGVIIIIARDLLLEKKEG